MNQNYDPNNWYNRHGVEPPTHIPHGITDEQLAEKFAQIRAETVHGDWVQQGNIITCRRCVPSHSAPIPVNYLLQGTAESGLPTLKKIDI